MNDTEHGSVSIIYSLIRPVSCGNNNAQKIIANQEGVERIERAYQHTLTLWFECVVCHFCR